MTDEKEISVKEVEDESVVELESQMVLRLPPTPAAALRAAVRSGVMNLKERLSVQIEPDMRHGIVKFDKWFLSGKIMDLPSVVETHKTLDCKTFYKTSDIYQIMVCKEEDDSSKTEEEDSPKKKDKKDAKDKRYMIPHGVTPPLKNIRKRRFRKTLKKKYVDFPDIEKEVKRLFRMDNEAISVRYEVVNAEDEKNDVKSEGGDFSSENLMTMGTSGPMSNSQSLDVAEYDLFGEVLSSSDGEGNLEMEQNENSQMSTSASKVNEELEKTPLVIEFSKNMLDSPMTQGQAENQDFPSDNDNVAVFQLESETAGENLGQILKEHKTDEEKTMLMEKLDELEHEISDLIAKRRAQELEFIAIENQALKQRFQNMIDNYKLHEREKQKEYDDIVTILQQT